MTVKHEEVQDFERLKLAVDAVKHITTLATGTIVLVATFADKLRQPVGGRGYLIGTIASMLLCLLTSFIYLYFATLNPFAQANPLSARGRFTVLSLCIYFSFGSGIACLAEFGLHNIGT